MGAIIPIANGSRPPILVAGEAAVILDDYLRLGRALGVQAEEHRPAAQPVRACRATPYLCSTSGHGPEAGDLCQAHRSQAHLLVFVGCARVDGASQPTAGRDLDAST